MVTDFPFFPRHFLKLAGFCTLQAIFFWILVKMVNERAIR